jgi:hypothetical protein
VHSDTQEYQVFASEHARGKLKSSINLDQTYSLTSLQILFAYEDELGEDVIASLDFWGRGQNGS